MNEETSVTKVELYALVRKVRKQIIVTITVCAVILFICLWVFKPAVKVDLTQLKGLEKNQIALTQQNQALRELVRTQKTAIDLLVGRDSSVLTRLDINKKAIENLKPHEILIDYTTYDSSELVRAYSNLR